MKFRGLIILILGLIVATNVGAQRFNIGIRAGLNSSKISGPAEEGLMEGSAFSSGIHFGLTYAYKMNERWGFKTELAYTDISSRDSIVGDSYYIFGIGTSNTPKEGYAKRFLEVSNSYINIPLHVYFKPIPKLEIFGGPYLGFLINPTAGGRIVFDDLSDETSFGFIQTFDYNYYQDEAREAASFTESITVIVDDQIITMPRIAGAYYQFAEKSGGRFNWFDMGLSAGAQYYINKSFFAGVRLDYGLLDITRRAMDVSYSTLNGSSFILRDDRDVNLSMQFSLGFKF